jgi:hypothetical protein
MFTAHSHERVDAALGSMERRAEPLAFRDVCNVLPPPAVLEVAWTATMACSGGIDSRVEAGDFSTERAASLDACATGSFRVVLSLLRPWVAGPAEFRPAFCSELGSACAPVRRTRTMRRPARVGAAFHWVELVPPAGLVSADLHCSSESSSARALSLFSCVSAKRFREAIP